MDLKPLLSGYDYMQIGNRSGGYYTNLSPWKLLLHTIEGSYKSAIKAYLNGVGNPHATVSLDQDVYTQHVRLDRSAYALRNAAGGTETNRDNVIQVEMEGFAGDVPEWGPEKLHKLAFRVIQPILLAVPGIKWRFADFSVMEYGLYAPQRWSAAKWDSESCILGHGHAPENTHWDPGMLNVDFLLDTLEA